MTDLIGKFRQTVPIHWTDEHRQPDGRLVRSYWFDHMGRRAAIDVVLQDGHEAVSFPPEFRRAYRRIQRVRNWRVTRLRDRAELARRHKPLEAP